MEKQQINIKPAEYEDLAEGYGVEISLNGIPAYLEAVDYRTGLRVGDLNVSVNYYAPDLDEIEVVVKDENAPMSR